MGTPDRLRGFGIFITFRGAFISVRRAEIRGFAPSPTLQFFCKLGGYVFVGYGVLDSLNGKFDSLGRCRGDPGSVALFFGFIALAFRREFFVTY